VFLERRRENEGAGMGEIRNAYKFLIRTLEGEDHFGYLGVDESLIFKCILKKWDIRESIGFISFRIGTSG
jgi:hypothetical protein